MALKKFNYKLKDDKKKLIIFCGILVLVLLVGVTIYNTYAAYKVTNSYNIMQGEVKFFEKRDLTLAVKLVDVDGNIEYSEDFPTDGYTFDSVKSYCVNGAEINYKNGKAIVSEISGKEKCTLYFNEYGELAKAILANNTIVITTPNFSQAATDVNTNLYKAEDDLGMSYYFRGATSNNYLQFGSYAPNTTINGTTYSVETPMYWRIVRINGDGTIRLVYDGTEKVENGVSHYALIGNTPYNSKAISNVNYGDSEIKAAIDSWYNQHIKLNYGSYITDGIFCNDKEIGKYVYYDDYGNITTVDKAAWYNTYYASYVRIKENNLPQLICTRAEDRYTTSTNLGNGYLEHPAGVLTADEIVLAGATTAGSNSAYYLSSGSEGDIKDFYYTSSPLMIYNFSGEAVMWRTGYGGLSNSEEGVLTVNFATRPVINIKANVEFTGNGSFETPFVIQTD